MRDAISVVGLGELGLCLAACFAREGLETVGVDVNGEVVEAVNDGISPIVEPGLAELVAAFGGTRLRATLSHAEAIDRTDVTFILVSTPSEPDGGFSNRYVTSALASLAEALAVSDKPNHVFVVSSTVIPGSTCGSLTPLIEKHSGRRLNSGFEVCYNPDFVALGRVIRDFSNPDFVLIGESRSSAGDWVESAYHRMCENEPKIVRTSIINAEIIKVSLKAYMTMKIGFANTVCEMCERMPGADVDVVTAALGLDKRISPLYLQGGLSYGGTCFPRDTSAFVRFASGCGCRAELVEAAHRVNERHKHRLSQFVLEHLGSKGRRSCSILGLAFKPDTPVITESPAISLLDDLLAEHVEVTVYDRLAMENTKKLFGDRIRYANSLEECLCRSPVCVITTPAPEFREIDERIIGRRVKIIDCWRILDESRLGPDAEYVPMGRGTGPARPRPVPSPCRTKRSSALRVG